MVSVEDAMCGGHFFPSLLRKEKNKQPVVVCLTVGCRPYGDRSHRDHDADNLWCDVRPWNTGRKTLVIVTYYQLAYLFLGHPPTG